MKLFKPLRLLTSAALAFGVVFGATGPFGAGNDLAHAETSAEQPSTTTEENPTCGPRSVWVNSTNQLIELKLSEDEKTVQIGKHYEAPNNGFIKLDSGAYTAYGDIAMSPDGTKLFGLQFNPDHTSDGTGDYIYAIDVWDISKDPIEHIKQHKARVSRSQLDTDSDEVANALSYNVAPDGTERLVAATWSSSTVLAINVDDVLNQDESRWQSTGKRFPQTEDGRKLVSAGDFVTMANGDLYGVGTTRVDDNKGPQETYLTVWPHATNEDARILGRVDPLDPDNPESVWGAGRVDDGIIMARVDLKNRDDRPIDPKGILKWAQLSGGSETNDTVVQGSVDLVDENGEVKNDLVKRIWGLAAPGDAGAICDEAKLTVKKNIERGNPADQFTLWAEDPSTGGSLSDPVTTAGSTDGLQEQEYATFVKPGDKLYVSESAAEDTPAKLSNYKTSLQCVREDTGETILTKEFDLNGDQTARKEELTVPENMTSRGTIACTFTNKKLPASVTVTKEWSLNGSPIAADEVPEGFTTKFNLTDADGTTRVALPQDKVEGYFGGTELTLTETDTTADYRNHACTLRSSKVVSRDGEKVEDSNDLPYHTTLDAGENTLTVANEISCTPPEEPSEPSEPTGPSEPIGPSEPSDPREPVEPGKPHTSNALEQTNHRNDAGRNDDLPRTGSESAALFAIAFGLIAAGTVTVGTRRRS